MTSSRDDHQPLDSPAGLLAFAREQRAIADAAEVRLLQAAVGWAVMHPAESITEAATLVERSFGDTGIPVAGPGAPLVAEFAIAEYAAAVGLSTDAGRRYLGHAVELRYRLEGLWQQVLAGRLVAWKARRIAETTLTLSVEAAAYVDKHVAPVAHQIGTAQLDRLVVEAIARHMPEQAEADRRAAWDQTHVTVHYATVGIAGTCQVTGELDLADALDLDHALAADAKTQADLGSVQTLDQRRATALGNIARRDLTLTYPTTETTTETTTENAG